MSSFKKRQSGKQASAESLRRTMNERRHEFTNRIRKAKKSQLLARKRRFLVVDDDGIEINQHASQSTQQENITNLAWAYIRSKDVKNLAALQSALAQSDSAAADSLLTPSPRTTHVLPSQDAPSLQLANALAHSLASPTSTEDIRLLASQVLTNLAATDDDNSAHMDDMDVDSYYGQPAESWCDVLVRSLALPALMQILCSDTISLAVCQQCCWAVGNLAGDSQRARDKAREAGVVPSLVSALHKGWQISSALLCRNATWALSNLARGTTTPGNAFMDHLTSSFIVQILLRGPEPASLSAGGANEATWMHVILEACWLVAFLTAREDETVEKLCFGSHMCEALATNLGRAAAQICIANVATESHNETALRMCIPCLRAIGNIATACRGKFIPDLLRAQDKSIQQSLSRIIQMGSASRGDVASVAVEATWAAGALLCDAGLPNHPSTTEAAPALLPVLSRTVVENAAKLELRREAISALWNAVAAPPNETDALQSRPTRDEFLSMLSTTTGFVTALTELLRSIDVEAVFSSLQILNAMLRRDRASVRHDFLEADGVDALEAVCDRASQTNVYGAGQNWLPGVSSQSADIAADLIDDFFGEELAEDEGGMQTSSKSPDGQAVPANFAFGVEIMGTPQQTFDFGQPSQSTVAGAFPVRNMGSGRGRGKPVPAWMKSTYD